MEGWEKKGRVIGLGNGRASVRLSHFAVDDVVVAVVAPNREIREAENQRMAGRQRVVQHVTLHVPTAMHLQDLSIKSVE